MSDDDPFSMAGDVLKTLFEKIVPEDVQGYSRLFTGWEKIAGTETAMHVVPRDVVRGALILEADHPGWTQRIRMRQEGLLAEVRSRYPELDIKRIKITVGSASPQTSRGSVSKPKSDIVEKTGNGSIKTPSVAAPNEDAEQDPKFRELMDRLRRHGKS